MTTPEARAALAGALRQSMGLGPDDDMRQDFGDIDGGRLLRPSEAASAILAALAASGWTVRWAASVGPSGWWSAEGDITRELTDRLADELPRAVAEGKQIVVVEGVTLRWHERGAADDPGEVERLRAALTIIADGTSYDPAGSIGVTARSIARAALTPDPGAGGPDTASEYGRLLAERDRLIADGADPADLEMPLPPESRS